jgi:hypothetical protein
MPPHEPINFRPTDEVLAWLKQATKGENRSRSNLLNTVLGRVTDEYRQSFVIEQFVKLIHEEDEHHGLNADGDGLRTGLWAAKWTLEVLMGEAAVQRALENVQRRTGKPIPHIGPRAQEGGRVGYDADAERFGDGGLR